MKKSTIVLDMDNTLLENVSIFNSPFMENDIVEDFTKGNIVIHRDKYKQQSYYSSLRKDVDKFLSLLPTRFNQVIIWSAGTCNYVESTCYKLFLPIGYLPTAILTREDCLTDKGVYYKPLNKIFKEYDADPLRTFLIDDSSSIFKHNEEWKDNIIQIPRYFLKNDSKDDDTMLSLIRWLNIIPATGNNYIRYPKPF